MEELTYNDLPDQFTDETVRELRKMAEIQSPSWIDIFGKMTFEQERMYLEIKSRQTKEEFELEEALKQKKFTQEDFDTKFRGWWTRFVNVDRHPSDLTIEDEIDALNDKTFYSSEKIKELFEHKAITRMLIRRNYINANEIFSFFWATKSPFSQWYLTSFTATSFLFSSNIEEKQKLLAGEIPINDLKYTSAEQFMMYQKAILFLDREIALQILKTDNVRMIKELGRKVRNYDEDVWRYNRSLIIYEGNKAKFTQNEELKKVLFSTQGTTLVEAAPNDNIWGIGLEEDDPRAKKRETWQGKNLLGEILTQLRVDLMGEY